MHEHTNNSSEPWKRRINISFFGPVLGSIDGITDNEDDGIDDGDADHDGLLLGVVRGLSLAPSLGSDQRDQC